MKKLLLVFLAVAMLLTFAACAADQPGDTGTDTSTDTPVTTDRATKETIKIGHIHINDEAEQGYSTAHINGVKAMQEALGLSDDQIIGKYNIGEDSACDAALRELVEAGCNIIFCDSFG
ncbi:MAG: BMP family ABC transporter substrate-binding protein, partial [Clostridiales bacterium]